MLVYLRCLYSVRQLSPPPPDDTPVAAPSTGNRAHARPSRRPTSFPTALKDFSKELTRITTGACPYSTFVVQAWSQFAAVAGTVFVSSPALERIKEATWQQSKSIYIWKVAGEIVLAKEGAALCGGWAHEEVASKTPIFGGAFLWGLMWEGGEEEAIFVVLVLYTSPRRGPDTLAPHCAGIFG